MSEQLDLLGPRQCLVDDAVDLGEHSINDQVLQLLLATDVAVQRAGHHPCVPEVGSPPLSCYVTAEGAHSDPPVAVQLIYVMLSLLR